MPTQFLLAKIYFQEIFVSQKLFASCIVRQSRILVEEATRKVELQKLSLFHAYVGTAILGYNTLLTTTTTFYIVTKKPEYGALCGGRTTAKRFGLV